MAMLNNQRVSDDFGCLLHNCGKHAAAPTVVGPAEISMSQSLSQQSWEYDPGSVSGLH